jgi:hypothetical protein
MELNLEALARIAYEAITAGHWWLLASVVVLAAVWALREYGVRLPVVGPKLAPTLAHPVVAWALPSVVSALAALTLALAAGQPVGVALLAALKVAAGAVFAYVGAKKVLEAQKLGAAAAGAIKTGEDALKAMDPK